MGRIYTYYIKKIFRTKSIIFWGMAFPIILGSLFYFAFHSIYGSQSSKAMQVVVVGENAEEHPFVQVLSGLTYENGSKMIDLNYATADEAVKMLETRDKTDQATKDEQKKEGDGKITKLIGVITLNSETDVTLEIAENDMYQSILSGIVSTYRAKAEFLQTEAQKGMDAYGKALEAAQNDIEYVAEQGMAGANKDPYIAQFYNLIAMMCLLAATTILDMLVSLQPNSSNTGLRVGASGVSRFKYEIGVLLASLTFQLLCTGIGLFYLIGILGLNFGGEMPWVILTACVGTIMGTALGFFVAHIGRFKYNTKNMILTLITLGGGAISGLYVIQMKAVIEESAPIINRINPMSVITDAFYSLNIFGVGDRYYRAMFTMLGLTAGLFLLGTLLSRRNQYESL